MKFTNTIEKIIRTAAILIMATGAVCSCDKPFEIEQPLGVTSKTVNLKASAGETPVIVYASEGWTAKLTEKVDWASIDRLEGYGMSQIKFAYSQNFGAARKVGIVFYSSKEIPDTVMMIQAAGIEKPNFQFAKAQGTAPKEQTSLQLGFHTDLIYNLEEITNEIQYEQENETGWITDLAITSDCVTCKLSENTTGADRSASITLTHMDAKENTNRTFMRIVQSAKSPEFIPDYSVLPNGVDCFGQDVEIPLSTNVSALFNQFTIEITYDGEEEWISDLKLEEDKISFKATENPGHENRTATITGTYTDEQGQTVNFSCDVVQQALSITYNFEDLKALISGTTGEMEINFANKNRGSLEGIVIGDKDNENMEINEPLLKVEKGVLQKRGFIWSGNPTTNYLQNAEGTSGLRLKFATEEDNVLSRYAKVNINLEGTKLIKESNPTRYTLSNIKAENIIANEEGTSSNVPLKEKNIAQLTDADVYTYTTVKDVEMTFKKGDYTNLHDGYAWKPSNAPKEELGTTLPFIDAVPASIRDAQGQSMYMIFNMKTPWRRSGEGVFQGTGKVSGIIVNTKLIRFAKDGDLGNYSLRVLEKEDIVETGNRFSKVLVEWDWAGQTTNLLTPTTGEGALSFSMPEGTTLTTQTEFNTLVKTSGVANGCLAVKRNYWWDDENDAAPYFLIEFSTKGISGTNLVLNWAIGQGNQGGTSITAPAYWHLEYSTDGSKFTKLEKDYAIRPMVWWNNSMSLSAVPGFHNYTTPLPSELFGQDKVILKLIASSKLAATADETKEQPTNSQPDNRIRIDQMAIEYN